MFISILRIPQALSNTYSPFCPLITRLCFAFLIESKVKLVQGQKTVAVAFEVDLTADVIAKILLGKVKACYCIRIFSVYIPYINIFLRNSLAF
jgi:hypothetical protein